MIIALANKMGAADKANSIYMRLLNFVYLDLNEKGGGYIKLPRKMKNFGQSFTTNGINSL